MKSSKRKKSARRKKRGIKMRNIIFSFLLLVLVFALGITGYIFSLLLKSEHTDIPIVESHSVPDGFLDDMSDPDDIEINTSDDIPEVTPAPVYWEHSSRVKVYVDDRFPIKMVERKDPEIENFLLFGIDSRSSYEQKARADSIIIISVDKRNNCIKLTSILRDTQVTIPGRTNPGKINSAYVFGGIGLFINTINDNFGLDIQKFAMVDMWSAEKIIDATGGLTIRIEENEIEQLNLNLRNTNNIFSKIEEPVPYIKTSGLILLNGRQAVAYGRIRKIGSDIQRTERQRRILTELIKQFKSTSITNKMSVIDEIARSFETNTPRNEIPALAGDVLGTIKNVAQYRIPASGLFTTNTQNWNLIPDLDEQIPALHNFIWGDDVGNFISLPEEPQSSEITYFSDSSDIISSQVSQDGSSSEFVSGD